MEQRNKVAIVLLENEIRNCEMNIASARDKIGRVESKIVEFKNRRTEEMEFIHNVDAGIVELKEAIHVLKGEQNEHVH